MRLRTRTFGAACAVVLLGFFGIPACGNDDSDTTTGQDEEAVEITTTVPVTTAVTTGLVQAILELSGDEAENYYEIEVTMDDGSTRWVRAEVDVINGIWPDSAAAVPPLPPVSAPATPGMQVEGIRGAKPVPYDGDQVEVVIEEVDGEELVTGPAE